MSTRGRRGCGAVLVQSRGSAVTRSPPRWAVAIERSFVPEIQGETNTRPDVRVARLAAAQHGVVSRAQLFELGLGAGAIEHRLHGLLHPRRRRALPLVELDSYAIHTTRQAEEDRERDRHLQASGYRVLRITWRQLTTNADTLAEEIRALLTAGPRPR